MYQCCGEKMGVWVVVIVGLLEYVSVVFACSLSDFLIEVEEDVICEQCGNKEQCFGRRSFFGGKYWWMYELMLVSFLKVRRYCDHAFIKLKKECVLCFMTGCILTGILFWSRGYGMVGVLCGISVTMLWAISIVDWKTQYIPVEFTGVVFICGLIRLFADLSNWVEYLIGLIAVSGFLLLVNWIATPILRERYEGESEITQVIGDGDIKLMAATGLLIGWKLNFLALGIGCIAGSVIHVILMKIKESGRQFALGPYLSLGVYITMICGEQLVSWYLNMVGIVPR